MGIFEHFLMHCLYFVLIVCSKSLPFFRFIINNIHDSFYAYRDCVCEFSIR